MQNGIKLTVTVSAFFDDFECSGNDDLKDEKTQVEKKIFIYRFLHSRKFITGELGVEGQFGVGSGVNCTT